jgi:hypothetical protein
MHFEINLISNLEIYLGEGCYRTMWFRVLNRVLVGMLLYFAKINRIFGVGRHSYREGSDLQL